MHEAGDPVPLSGHDSGRSTVATRLGPSHRLDSPEQVRLDLELAGPMSRAFAYSIDYSLIWLGLFAALLVFVSGLQQIFDWASEATLLQNLFDGMTQWLAEGELEEQSRLMRAIALVIVVWMILDLILTSLYFVFFETLFAGRTPGKRLTQLRVVTESGAALGWKTSAIRNLLRAVDTLPAGYLIGVAAMMLSPRAQRLGDVVAGTLVVRERSTNASELLLHTTVDPDVEAGFRFTRDELMAIGEVERRLIRRSLGRAEGLSKRAARPIITRATDAICLRIGRSVPVSSRLQRDFLTALLQASERLL
jgi:uncharacterized RDD family membrane protein YckC